MNDLLRELVRTELMERFSDVLSMEEIASAAYAIETKSARKDRRHFWPARIKNRGKTSLPFTTRERDFVPDEKTARRKTDAFDEVCLQRRRKR